MFDLLYSSIGTSVAEVLTLPICTIKTNYQTNLNYKSIIDVTKDIYKSKGIYGFYNASLSAITAQVVSTSTKFTTYNYIKKFRNTQKHDIKNNIINGAIGGMVASVFSHPFDVIKIHQQNQVKFLPQLNLHGPMLFYRGYSKTLSKNIMLTAILFPFYDFYYSKTKNLYVASILSTITTTAIVQPIDYLKVRHISNQQLYWNFTDIRQSLRYYYRGFHVNLMRVMPHFLITMYIIEKMKSAYDKKIE